MVDLPTTEIIEPKNITFLTDFELFWQKNTYFVLFSMNHNAVLQFWGGIFVSTP